MYGNKVSVGAGKARVYLFQADVAYRTHQQHCRDAQKALEDGTVRHLYKKKNTVIM